MLQSTIATVVCACLPVTVTAQPSPPYQCAPEIRQLGSSDYDSGHAVAVDSDRNVYISGGTWGDLPGHVNAGGRDIFVAKYAPCGALIWVEQFGTEFDEWGGDVAVDAAGNAFVTGYTGGAFPNQDDTASWDVFLAKYDTDGNQQWVRQIGSMFQEGDDRGYRVEVDSAGNAYVVGVTWGEFHNMPCCGPDAFVAKFSPDGSWLWVTQFDTEALFDDVRGCGVTVHSASGNVYVTGWTEDTFDGYENAGGIDAFLAKFDLGGAQQWVVQFGTNGEDVTCDPAVDSAGNIFVTGYTTGGFDDEPNLDGADAFLAKYNSSGALLWLRQFGTDGHEWAYDTAVDTADNVYVAGGTGGSGGLQGGVADEPFLVRYGSDGTKLWQAEPFGTPAADDAWGVDVDSADHVYVCGPTLGSFPGQENAGDFDAYLAKWPGCLGDSNGDCGIDVLDLVYLILPWGTHDPRVALACDGIIDVLDLVQLILKWGPC